MQDITNALQAYFNINDITKLTPILILTFIGLPVAIGLLPGFIQYLFSYFFGNKSVPTVVQKSGNNSNNYQSNGNITINKK